jgi:hypothetical protein
VPPATLASCDAWDLDDLRGKTARIQIIDNDTGSWGHLNAGQFTLTSTP